MKNETDISSLNDIQRMYEEAFQYKTLRKYELALSVIESILSVHPMALAGADIWRNLFNAPLWFSNKNEDDSYFSYAYHLMNKVLDKCTELDEKSAILLSDSFVKGALFRHTVHHQKNIKSFMQLRADLYDFSLTDCELSRNFTFHNAVSRGGKLRFGILFKHLLNDPELTSLLPFFDGVASDDIEVTVFVLANSGDEVCVGYVKSICNNILIIPDKISSAVSFLRDQDLDILLFGNDITAKPSFCAYLSFFRLSRLTACCVSTLVTTCSPYVDLYFGSDYYDKRGFSKEYNERFLSFPNPGFAFWFPEPKKISASISRSALGVDDDAILLVSGANQTKLHTDLISVWSEILHKVPSAILILYPFPPHFGPAREEVTARIYNDFFSFGIGKDRVFIFSPILGRENVINFLKVMDLGLDSFPYTGVTTIVDAIEAGLPTITYAGDTLRTSQGASILNSIDVDELIVFSKDEYVKLAVTLSSGKSILSNLKEKIKAARLPFCESKKFGATAKSVYQKLYQELKSKTGTENVA